MQDGCILAFSIGMPLLSRRLRRNVHRCYAIAAAILEDLESPLLGLRAQLHLEVSRCETASDFLVKAAGHSSKALRLDHGSECPS
ncbi:unnamed protein product, partial [Discosporangium mesarthrocarpum]